MICTLCPTILYLHRLDYFCNLGSFTLFCLSARPLPSFSSYRCRDDWEGVGLGLEGMNGMNLVEAMAEAMDEMRNNRDEPPRFDVVAHHNDDDNNADGVANNGVGGGEEVEAAAEGGADLLNLAAWGDGAQQPWDENHDAEEKVEVDIYKAAEEPESDSEQGDRRGTAAEQRAGVGVADIQTAADEHRWGGEEEKMDEGCTAATAAVVSFGTPMMEEGGNNLNDPMNNEETDSTRNRADSHSDSFLDFQYRPPTPPRGWRGSARAGDIVTALDAEDCQSSPVEESKFSGDAAEVAGDAAAAAAAGTPPSSMPVVPTGATAVAVGGVPRDMHTRGVRVEEEARSELLDPGARAGARQVNVAAGAAGRAAAEMEAQARQAGNAAVPRQALGAGAPRVGMGDAGRGGVGARGVAAGAAAPPVAEQPRARAEVGRGVAPGVAPAVAAAAAAGGGGGGAADNRNDDVDDGLFDGDVDVHMAIDELLGLRGPLTMLVRNVLWLLAFHGAYLGLFAFFPFSIGARFVGVDIFGLRHVLTPFGSFLWRVFCVISRIREDETGDSVFLCVRSLIFIPVG